MIFVTVGTHEQPFDRLIKKIDELVEKKVIKEKVIIQIGYSDYIPKNCEFEKMYAYEQMEKLVLDARIIITHGGPASFIMPLRHQKIPIVVPRKAEFNEHVNNHQVDFCKAVEKRMGFIRVVEDINDIEFMINTHMQDSKKTINSNNKMFCCRFENIVEELMEK